MEVLSQMSAKGLQPRSYAYNGCITACARAGETSQTMKLLSTMKASGVAPDLVSFNAALLGMQRASGPSRSGAWKQALQLLTQMGDRSIEPDVVSYANAVAACRRGGQATQAIALLDAAAAKGLKPNEGMLCDALTAIAIQGDADVAASRLWAMLLEMGDGTVPPSARAFHARIYERGTAKDWQAAVALLDEMKSAGMLVSAGCCEHAARACSRAGAWQEASTLLERCEAVYGVARSERLYCSAIQACGKAGKWEAAMELLKGAQGASLGSVGVYGAAMDALSACGQWEQCLQLLKTMEAAGVVGDVGLYGSALHALQAARQWESVYELLYMMRAEGVTTPETMLPYHITLWKMAKKELERKKKKKQ